MTANVHSMGLFLLRPQEMTFADGNELHCIARAIDQALERRSDSPNGGPARVRERPRGSGVAKIVLVNVIATQLSRAVAERRAWITAAQRQRRTILQCQEEHQVCD
jgi:hypothetical protein